MLSAVARWNPISLLRALNICLRTMSFPRRRKRAKVLLVHKGPSKPIYEPSSFRPISLLDGMGKLLERLVLNRVARLVAAELAPN